VAKLVFVDTSVLLMLAYTDIIASGVTTTTCNGIVLVAATTTGPERNGH